MITKDEKRSESLEELIRAKNFYKEFITILKDTLDVGWKISPVAFLPAGLFLWSYLQSIHWTGLFQESLTTVSGLVFLFVVALLLATAVLLQFAIPSIIFILITSPTKKLSKSVIYTIFSVKEVSKFVIPKYVLRIFQFALIGWVVSLALLIFIESDYTRWLAIAMPAVTSLSYSIWSRWRVSESITKGFFKHFSWSLAATLIMLFNAFPLITGIRVAGYIPDIKEGWLSAAVFATCVVVSLISLLPGFLFLNGRTSDSSIYRPTKFAIAGAFLSFYVVAMGIAFFSPVSSIVVKLAGIYSNDVKTFQVREVTLTPAMEAAGLNVNTSKNFTVVRAYLRYGFGGYKLLCASEFNQANVSNEAVQKARNEKKPDPRLAAGRHCALAYANEIREIRE